jgi:hypothetical protein
MESLTEGSSLGTEDMDLVSNLSTSPLLISYLSIKDSEDHDIYIFDGEQYVPISPVSQIILISPLISSTNIFTPPAPQTLELPLVEDLITTLASIFGIDFWNKPPNTLYYEKKTSEPDMWGYLDASSWSVHAHRPEPTLVPLSFYDSSPPPGYLAWCAQNGVSIVCHHFTINFEGEIDNHLLRNWENQFLIYTESELHQPHRLEEISQDLDTASGLIVNTEILPRHWNR